MSGAHQGVFMNQRSFGPNIGDALGGGFFAGQISTTANSVATHNLIVAPLSAGATQTEWAVFSNATIPGALSNINGPTNTADIVFAGSATAYPAGHFCNNLSLGGAVDWYLPAQNELEVCYFNLKPTTANNSTGFGANPNAVPARVSNYTTGNPAQTSAAAFQTGGAQAFPTTGGGGNRWWSSTQDPSYGARNLDFVSGALNSFSVYNAFRVRAIRRVAV